MNLWKEAPMNLLPHALRSERLTSTNLEQENEPF